MKHLINLKSQFIDIFYEVHTKVVISNEGDGREIFFHGDLFWATLIDSGKLCSHVEITERHQSKVLNHNYIM